MVAGIMEWWLPVVRKIYQMVFKRAGIWIPLAPPRNIKGFEVFKFVSNPFLVLKSVPQQQTVATLPIPLSIRLANYPMLQSLTITQTVAILDVKW